MKYKIALIVFVFISFVSGQNTDHSLFTEILKDYNHNGMIDYQQLKEDKRLDKYLEYLSNVNHENLKTKEAKVAYWINVYNAFTIKAIVDNYPVESINDLHTGGLVLGIILSTTVWDEDFININGKEYSLNDIEHKILRKKFKEPRIHFAIVCASISCPQLRKEAFTESNLNTQLEDQAKKFFNDTTRNKFDIKNKVAYLSKILDWFSEDFGDSDENVLSFAANYLNEPLKSDILNNIKNWTVDYLDYDWGLNDYKN